MQPIVAAASRGRVMSCLAMSHIDQHLRSRIAAWMRYYANKYLHEYGTREAFGRKIGMSGTHVTNIMNERRDAGLDVLVKMHRSLHVSLDTIIDTDPPKDESERDTPREASPARVAPGRRKRADG